jgi:hypothetical protein
MIYESKWGYHPCDYQGYLKLRRLHSAYWEGLRLFAKYERWERKAPQNRLKMPEIDGVYRQICRSNIVEVFHQARRPMAGPEGVSPISSSYWQVVNEWIDLLDKSEAKKESVNS